MLWSWTEFWEAQTNVDNPLLMSLWAAYMPWMRCSNLQYIIKYALVGLEDYHIPLFIRYLISPRTKGIIILYIRSGGFVNFHLRRFKWGITEAVFSRGRRNRRLLEGGSVILSRNRSEPISRLHPHALIYWEFFRWLVKTYHLVPISTLYTNMYL